MITAIIRKPHRQTMKRSSSSKDRLPMAPLIRSRPMEINKKARSGGRMMEQSREGTMKGHFYLLTEKGAFGPTPLSSFASTRQKWGSLGQYVFRMTIMLLYQYCPLIEWYIISQLKSIGAFGILPFSFLLWPAPNKICGLMPCTNHEMPRGPDSRPSPLLI